MLKLCFLFPGKWSIGLATLNCDLNKLPLGNDSASWVLSHDGSLVHDGVAIDNIDLSVSEGDYMVCIDRLHIPDGIY